MRLPHCASLLALVFVACSPEPERARHTVEDYRANDALREATVRKCTNDPGTLGKTPDCVNALRAASLESTGGLRNSPPVGLEPERNPFRTPAPQPPDDAQTSAPDADQARDSH